MKRVVSYNLERRKFSLYVDRSVFYNKKPFNDILFFFQFSNSIIAKTIIKTYSNSKTNGACCIIRDL